MSENKPISTVNDLHICTVCENKKFPIITGSPTTKIDGQPVARIGDKTACGAIIIQGSSTSKADNIPVAYIGANTSHDGTKPTGKIITGKESMLVTPA